MPLIPVNSWFGTRSKFFTQTMRHCTPHTSLIASMSGFFVGAVIFIAIGVGAFSGSNSQLHVRAGYADGTPLRLELPLSKLRNDGLYFYYHLQDFHQNARMYINSIDRAQLRGTSFTVRNAGAACTPKRDDGPCGLIYDSYFNDTYVIRSTVSPTAVTTSPTLVLTLNDSVAWPSDFKNDKVFGPAFKNLSDAQRKAVWMRVSPFKSFSKPYGYLSKDEVSSMIAQAKLANIDSIILEVVPTSNFPYGKKFFEVQQMTVLGGWTETRSIAILSIVAGCVLFLFGVSYAILFLTCGRRSRSYSTVLDKYPIVTNSSILLAEFERTGDDRVKAIVHQVKAEMHLT
ncbi:Cell division control protein CDC50 [Giardia muris]|uniref:Cell division control protein CDC50 n=1 Tax=Giardia muris TaxID=5742 RepID=A0A4Z1SV68_GIAMU|nr:Cell division control protein CDC50 [Giardia muris]|eukprot:TNJ29782.1 Cell division control protein CDC50 [Giardia muris]